MLRHGVVCMLRLVAGQRALLPQPCEMRFFPPSRSGSSERKRGQIAAAGQQA
jgi:hypothetical protein